MVGHRNNSLAIALPKLGVFSETFIQAQLDSLLPGIILHGGFFPGQYKDFRPGHQSEGMLPYSKDSTDLGLGQKQDMLAQWLQERGVKTLLAQYGLTGAALAPACEVAGIRLLVHFHGFDASHHPTLQQQAGAYQYMFDRAYRVIAVSRPMEVALRALGCPPEKLLYNPYGVQDRFFQVQPSYKDPVFVSVGRFVEKKAPARTLEAFRAVVQRFPEARLWMAGDGPLLATCRDLAATWGIADKVRFPGILTHEMVPAFFQRARIYVQHSVTAESGDSEGTPVSILEASASALPVVSTRHAGIPEAVRESVTGLLVDEHDVRAMADAMIRFLEKPGLAQEMGAAGRAHIARRYSMDRYLQALRELI